MLMNAIVGLTCFWLGGIVGFIVFAMIAGARDDSIQYEDGE